MWTPHPLTRSSSSTTPLPLPHSPNTARRKAIDTGNGKGIELRGHGTTRSPSWDQQRIVSQGLLCHSGLATITTWEGRGLEEVSWEEPGPRKARYDPFLGEGRDRGVSPSRVSYAPWSPLRSVWPALETVRRNVDSSPTILRGWRGGLVQGHVSLAVSRMLRRRELERPAADVGGESHPPSLTLGCVKPTGSRTIGARPSCKGKPTNKSTNTCSVPGRPSPTQSWVQEPCLCWTGGIKRTHQPGLLQGRVKRAKPTNKSTNTCSGSRESFNQG